MASRTELRALINSVKKEWGNSLFLTPPIVEDTESHLFTSPSHHILVKGQDDIKRIGTRIKSNPDLLGYLTLDYEFGYLPEESLTKLLKPKPKKFGSYYEFLPSQCRSFPSKSVLFPSGSSSGKYSVCKIRFKDDEETFNNKIKKLKDYILDGETYQINLTTECYFLLRGDIVYFIRDLLFNQSAGYIAIINNGGELILSISPELFFKYEDGFITTAPMKGTRHRGFNIENDNLQKEKLLRSKKEQAENLMIVDLLRNDIGRICKFGSVKVNSLFQIETLETVHQMVSYISGVVRDDVSFEDIIYALFPCGSVTGAPKIAAMKIIHELERRRRGLYTGAIFLFRENTITANVAIRTIKLQKRGVKNIYDGILPVGSGVVWDSSAKGEYKEIKKKTEFLTAPTTGFYLFETILWDGSNFTFLNEHLDRLEKTAHYFLFRFDRGTILSLLRNYVQTAGKSVVKLILEKWGGLRVEIREFAPHQEPLKVGLSINTTSSRDKFFYFKTSKRDFYDAEFNLAKKAGFDEVLFYNQSGFLTEGSRNSIFFKLDGVLYTPPVEDGLLAGVFRQVLLERDECRIRRIHQTELNRVEQWYIGNSVYGLRKISLNV